MSEKKPKALALNRELQKALVQNALMERSAFLSKLMDPRRDIAKECGHPESVDIKDFGRLFTRGDVAARVVSVWPEECWSERPQVYETEDPTETKFEKEWKALEVEFALFPMLQRADIMSGIGRFGVILLGLDDGQPLETAVLPDTPVEEAVKSRKLIYTRVFDESCVSVKDFVTEKTSPRFGMPKTYTVNFQDVSLPGTVGAVATQSVSVHWSRVVHIADNRTNSEIYGLPRMEKVLNRLLDLNKIAGGSAEMFWKGGFPGISLEALPEALTNQMFEIDVEKTRAQIEGYMNGLQRYIATVGMKANSLSVQIADPGGHSDTQLKMIATALGIPWRIFVGSEAAQLASEQDIKSWHRRLARRRNEYVSPYIVFPFVRRLIQLGVLPPPGTLYVDWPDLNTPSEKDRAAVAQAFADALSKYVMSGADALIPPFHFLTLALRLTPEEAQAALDEAGLDGRMGNDPLLLDRVAQRTSQRQLASGDNGNA